MKRQRSATKKLKCCDRFSISIPCSVTYFLEVGARVSLKVVTRESFRNKKQKRRSATKKFEKFLINLALLYLVELATYFLEVGACVSLKVATIVSL